jgi:hypothetical protein
LNGTKKDDKQTIPVQQLAALLYDGPIEEAMLRNYRKMQILLSRLLA